jgi:hypothetical protein
MNNANVKKSNESDARLWLKCKRIISEPVKAWRLRRWLLLILSGHAGMIPAVMRRQGREMRTVNGQLGRNDRKRRKSTCAII